MKKRIPIFQRILFPLMFLIISEIFILIFVLFAQGLQLDNLIAAVAIAGCIALIGGICVSLAISYRIQRPIARIAEEIASANPRDILCLTPTGIEEVDAMSDEIMKLSYDVIQSGRKFSKIMEMSRVHMSGFQINYLTNSLFLTEDFFKVFGEQIDQTDMTIEDFDICMRRYKQFIMEENPENEEYIFCMPMGEKYGYIRLCIHETEHSRYGLVEDVTKDFLEKQMLQHERDHDSLTNLYNRRAFRAKMNQFLAMSGKQLKCAALIMIDLDNLKYFNDTYGHEYGDQYIIHAANALSQAIPEQAVCARISGDEFNAFLYGYSSKEELAEEVVKIQKAVNSGTFLLPDGNIQLVHATGGVAYYPEHSRSLEGLSKYADYAMYVAKRNHKRYFQEFDFEMFCGKDIQLRNSETLTKMLQYSLVHFELQPIVDVRTGDVFAYEALMRPDVDQFFTVHDVIETARKDGKLCQVEEMTLFKALETFDDHMKRKNIPENTHLFVNSFANQCISVEKGELFVEKYGKYAKQLVLELTEQEKIDPEIWEMKAFQHRILGGKFALDDYGSGYNSEITLLELSPDYIKIDMSIARDIHTNKDKQQIVDNIVKFAHERGKFVVAEGIETKAEVKKLLKLKVDYMQGYFFGKPQASPQGISKEGLEALDI